jgi:hypothetical protein
VPTLTPEALERFAQAQEIWLQASATDPEGDAEINGDRKRLQNTVVGCQIETAEDLGEAAANENTDRLGSLVQELQHWIDLRDQLAGEGS